MWSNPVRSDGIYHQRVPTGRMLRMNVECEYHWLNEPNEACIEGGSCPERHIGKILYFPKDHAVIIFWRCRLHPEKKKIMISAEEDLRGFFDLMDDMEKFSRDYVWYQGFPPEWIANKERSDS